MLSNLKLGKNLKDNRSNSEEIIKVAKNFSKLKGFSSQANYSLSVTAAISRERVVGLQVI